MSPQLYNLSAELIALLIGILHIKKLDNTIKLLFSFVCFAFLTELTLIILIKAGIKDTRPGVHFYVMIEFFLLMLFFSRMLKGFINVKLIWVIIILFEIYCVVNILAIRGLHDYPNFARATENLILIILSVLLFSRIMIEARLKKLSKEPMIWFNSAILIYFAGNFFFNILYNTILEFSMVFLKQIANFYIFMNVLFYLLIAIGFWNVKKKAHI